MILTYHDFYGLAETLQYDVIMCSHCTFGPGGVTPCHTHELAVQRDDDIAGLDNPMGGIGADDLPHAEHDEERLGGGLYHP
jgi:hypothetical protein